MADNDEFEENGEETPKDLRAQIKKLAKSNADLVEQNEKLSGTVRSRSIADHLSSKGLSAKVAGFVPASVATDPASLDAWLTEYGDVFGAPKPADAPEETDEDDAETRAAQQRVADAASGALPAGKLADLEARMNAATSVEELEEVLASVR